MSVINHTNYVRQLRKQMIKLIERDSKILKEIGMYEESVKLLLLSRISQNFILPDGGDILDDDSFSAINENEKLNLPFPCIALEYSRAKYSKGNKDVTQPTKGLFFAVDADEEWIDIYPCLWHNKLKGWAPAGSASIPKNKYLIRDSSSVPQIAIASNHEKISAADYKSEAGVLFGFINALSCSNISITRSKAKNSNKKTKTPLGFDDYHILTLKSNNTSPNNVVMDGAERRSPRKHLRRGHIRRLNNGNRVWVNASIINAHREGGFVSKDYRLI